jgi:hypothetical protein
MERKPITSTVAGLILSLVIILYSLVLTFTGLNSDPALTWLTYLILVVGVVVFITMYGRAMNHRVTFGGLFAYGFKASAITALLVIACMVIVFYAFPDLKEKMFDAMRTNMEKDGKLSDSEINEAMEMSRKYFMVGLVGGGLFFMLLCGTIGSLIGAAMTKKLPPNPIEQLDA